jgi:3-oxoacyl-[acyl-carrier protein] reductase
MKHRPTCLITGAAGGIGTAIANKLSILNYDLILVSKRKVKLEKLKNRLKVESKNRISSYPCDFSNLDEIKKLIKVLRQKRVDVLINNAAVFNVKDFTKEKYPEMLETVNVNLLAPIMLCKSVIEKMKKYKKGRIIFIGSTSAYKGEKNIVTYCVSKHGLLGLSKSINDEFNRYNIQSTIISPGLVKTGIHKKYRAGQNFDTFIDPDEFAEYIANLIEVKASSFIPEILVRRRFA